MQFLTPPQKLIHIESYTYKDKEGNETLKKRLHFADVSTSRVKAYSFKGDTSNLNIADEYVLTLEQYEINGRSGFYISSLKLVN